MDNGELLREIYTKVSKIETDLARVDEKVTQNGKSLADHEGRLRSVEKKVYIVSGAGAAIGWLASRFLK